MKTIVIDGRAHLVLAGDPDRAQAEPGKHLLAVMHVADGEAAICTVEWLCFERGNEGEWWNYPDGVTFAPVAALREALAIAPSNQLTLPGIE